MPERFLVFIPAYNCEKQVPRVLNQLLDCQVAAMVTECIMVNNRSTDGTEAAVQSWMQAHPQAPVRLLQDHHHLHPHLLPGWERQLYLWLYAG